MSVAFNITPPPEAKAIIARNRDKPGFGQALARTMDTQNQLTVARIQRVYMSFPKAGPVTMEGTRVQSNRLRSSVNATRAAVTGEQIISSLGSNVIYAPRQEFGFDGEVTISAHTRKSRAGRKTSIAIQSYTQQVHQEGRHMFSKGINDRLGDYGQAFLDTALKFSKGDN